MQRHRTALALILLLTGTVTVFGQSPTLQQQVDALTLTVGILVDSLTQALARINTIDPPPPAHEPAPTPDPDPTPAPVPDPPPPPPPTLPPGGGNSYFEAIAPAAYRAIGLRSQAEIDRYSQTSPNASVTYDATMDAAKVSIPAFIPHRVLGTALDATSNVVTFTSAVNTSLIVTGRGLLIDDEVLTVYQPSGASSITPAANQVYVQRGQGGTAAAPHQAGAAVQMSVNSLPNQVRLPVGSEPGHAYLFVWDTRYDLTWTHPVFEAYKSYQLSDANSSGSDGGTWWEMRHRHDGVDGIGTYADWSPTTMVGLIDARSYNTSLTSAPVSEQNVTSILPVKPQDGRFVVLPNRWVRWFAYVQQNDGVAFDRVSLWVADEQTDPVQIYANKTVRVRGSIKKFWLELNTSRDNYRGYRSDLVSWFRNWVMVKDPTAVTPYLVRP